MSPAAGMGYLTATWANSGLEVMAASLSSMILAQGYKFIMALIKERGLNFRRLVQTGGMPSSHSSTVSAMATSVGLIDGFSSVSYAIALSFALVVMYDAAGLRQAAGRMASVLNRISESVYSNHPEQLPERLRELLGHTPFEVFVGALFGISWAFIIHMLL